MSKKFNTGDTVAMTNSCLNYHIDNFEEMYTNPGGIFHPNALNDYGMLVAAKASGKPLAGTIKKAANDNGCYYVTFKNEFGIQSHYFESKNLVLIKKKGKKRARR